jgi:DICT domain-containing protein
VSNAEAELTIGDVVAATGLGESTLRAWERRYGFPSPGRGVGASRRYRREDVERILQVMGERDRGVGLARAIARAGAAPPPPASFFAGLRERRPELRPASASKRHLLPLSRAIENASFPCRDEPIWIGSFQHERFYRSSEERWRQLTSGSTRALVFADFAARRSPVGGPEELPLADGHPAMNEWVLISIGASHAAALVAIERPEPAASELERSFECLFTVEPTVVREAAGVAVALVVATDPALADSLASELDSLPEPGAESQLRMASAITTRMLAELG